MLSVLRSRLLVEENQDIRMMIVRAIAKMGKEAQGAEPEILVKLADYDDYAFSHTPEAAFAIGVPPEKAVPLLKVAVMSSAAWRREAAIVIGRYGTSASSAVDALTTQLVHSDNQVREAVAWALGRIGPEAKLAVPDLANLLWDPDESVRGYAARALAQITREFDAGDEQLDENSDEFSFGESFQLNEDSGELEVVIRARKWWKEKGSTQEWK